MGMETDAKLFFGWEVDFETVLKFVSKVHPQIIDDNEYLRVILDEECIYVDEINDEEIENGERFMWFISFTSPYYDCEIMDCKYFITMFEGRDSICIKSIQNIIKNYKKYPKQKLENIMKTFNIEDEPEFIVVPYIW